MDTIYIKDLLVTARHGVLKKEHRERQRFSVSVLASVDTGEHVTQDTINKTLDYRKVRDTVLEIMHGRSHKLIEVLAAEIATKVLTDKRVAAIEVGIEKLDVWTNGRPGVIIRRSRTKV